MKKLIFIIITILPSSLFANALGMQWQTNSLSYLYGDNYELGEEERNIVTWEHFSGWVFGDIFIFVDITDPGASDQQTYGEIHPRFSLSKITKQSFSWGFIKDVLIATEIEFGEGHRAYLYGIGFDLDIPHFNYFGVNIYVRDQEDLDGTTYQISPYWSLPINIGDVKLSLDGFADIDGGQDWREESILFVPQLMLDVGHFWGKDDKIMIGAEWQYWDNKYGIDGVEESVVQALVKVKF